jgi:hypothetical protein
MEDPRFDDIPASPEAAKEEIAFRELWLQDLQVRLNQREVQLGRLNYLNGYVAAIDQANALVQLDVRVAEDE